MEEEEVGIQEMLAGEEQNVELRIALKHRSIKIKICLPPGQTCMKTKVSV